MLEEENFIGRGLRLCGVHFVYLALNRLACSAFQDALGT
jgi:hypothetical protein